MMLCGTIEELSRQQRGTSEAFTTLRIENQKLQVDVADLGTAKSKRMEAEADSQRLRENVAHLSRSLADLKASNSHLQSQQQALFQEKSRSLRLSNQRHEEEQKEATVLQKLSQDFTAAQNHNADLETAVQKR